jgi:hypothetical protein
MPQRIQRKRVKGWKCPPNTVYVGRGSKWQNPHTPRVIERPDGKPTSAEEALELYRRDLPYLLDKASGHLDISELRGKNLMCWCAIGAPCHADLLLELANSDK